MSKGGRCTCWEMLATADAEILTAAEEVGTELALVLEAAKIKGWLGVNAFQEKHREEVGYSFSWRGGEWDFQASWSQQCFPESLQKQWEKQNRLKYKLGLHVRRRSIPRPNADNNSHGQWNLLVGAIRRSSDACDLTCNQKHVTPLGLSKQTWRRPDDASGHIREVRWGTPVWVHHPKTESDLWVPNPTDKKASLVL